MVAAHDISSAEPKRRADQDGPADESATQAGDPDAGARHVDGDPVSAGRSRADPQAVRGAGPRLRRTGCRCRLTTFALRGDLAGSPTRTFEADHGAAVENLAAPHAPGLATVQRLGQASLSNRAVG